MIVFGIGRQRNFDGKSWYSPPFLIDKLFRHQKLSATQHRKNPLRCFSVLWEKKSTKNWDITLLGRNFWKTEVSDTLKCSPANCLYYETNPIRRKNSDSRPYLIPNIFRFPKSLKHLRVPLWKISALCDKKVAKANLDTFPLSYP